MKAFIFGAIGYPLLELAYRRRTHPSMALAGGLAAAALYRISQTDRPLHHQAMLGGLAVTGIEYGIGVLFNREYRIWDYRRLPWNVQGQICLPFTLVWCALSAAVIGVFRLKDHMGDHQSSRTRHSSSMRRMLRMASSPSWEE